MTVIGAESTHLQNNAWIVIVDQSVAVTVVHMNFNREGKVEGHRFFLKQYQVRNNSSVYFLKTKQSYSASLYLKIPFW